MSESFPALRADIEWRANTGTVKADIAAVRRDFRESVSAMSSDALKLSLSQDKLNKALARHGPESAAAKRAEVEFRAALQQTTAAAQREAGVLNEVTAAKTRFGQAGVYASKGADQMRRSTVGASAAFLGATGLVFALQSGIRSAVEFDRSMRNVNSIAHLSEQQLAALSQEVVKLSNSTGKGPQNLADGLYDIVSSGFQANDALKILEVSAKAASAGMTDTATSSKGVVAILNAYHLQASEARRVSDLLFQEVNLGVNTFEELSQNLGDTVPQAAALKIPFEQVAAALAQITKNGTPMAEASTQVSRVLTALIKPSKELQSEFRRMGYESGQAAVEALGFAGVLDRLSRDAGGNQQTIAAWLGEVRGIRGVLNLTGDNLAGYNDMLAQMGQATDGAGATARAFAEQQKSLGFQLDRTRANLQALASSQGGVNTALAGTARNVADLTGGLVELSVAAQKVGSADLPGPLGSFFDTIDKADRWMNPFRQQLELVKKAMDDLGGSTDSTVASLGDLAHARNIVAPGEGNLGGSGGASAPPKATTAPAGGSSPDIDYRIALESSSGQQRLGLLRGHVAYIDGRIARLKAEKNLAGWQKQQLLKLIQQRNTEQAQIDQILAAAEKDTAATQAARERSQLSAEKQFERTSGALRSILKAQSRASSTKGKQDDVDEAQREVGFWRNRLEQIDRASGAYEHVAAKLTAAEDKLARAQGKLDASKQTASSSPAAQLQAPRDLRLRQLQAALTDSQDDDLRVARVVESYWRRRLDQTKKTSKVYEDILQQLVSAHDAVKSIEGQLSDQGPKAADQINQTIREAMAGLVQINRSYGSDVRGPQVTVNQHFQQTPVDYFAESYHAKAAMTAAMKAGN